MINVELYGNAMDGETMRVADDIHTIVVPYRWRTKDNGVVVTRMYYRMDGSRNPERRYRFHFAGDEAPQQVE